MISENWNFIWDKNSISDVSYNGLVTDVADIFKSSELKHKLGTVYSILYSLHHNHRSKFTDFIKLAGLRHTHHMDFVLNSIKIINKFGCNTDILNIGNDKDVYVNTVKHYLIEGKNCGDCSFVGLGDQIRETYRKNTLELT